MQDNMKQGSATGRLARLDDMDDYKVADGEPDVRGWDVKTADGQKAGKVDTLIVDTGAMKVRFLGVALDKKTLKLSEDRHVLIPISGARIDDDKDNILLGSLTAGQLSSLPPYSVGQPIMSGQTPPPRDADARQFYGKRGGTGDVQRMMLSEEELKVGKRQKQAGEVNVHKTVETQHVSEKVPLMHEEVTVERRPVSAGASDPDGITESEIRIPIMAEEAVVEKRAVAKEELVINKRQVKGEQTVQADLKREQVDVDRSKSGSRSGRDVPPDQPAR